MLNFDEKILEYAPPPKRNLVHFIKSGSFGILNVEKYWFFLHSYGTFTETSKLIVGGAAIL